MNGLVLQKLWMLLAKKIDFFKVSVLKPWIIIYLIWDYASLSDLIWMNVNLIQNTINTLKWLALYNFHKLIAVTWPQWRYAVSNKKIVYNSSIIFLNYLIEKVIYLANLITQPWNIIINLEPSKKINHKYFSLTLF